MTEDRFLIVRLGSLGDIVHTLPAAAALCDSYPGARVDWVVESRWLPLLAGNPDLNQVIALDRDSWGAIRRCVGRLRKAGYTCALDFQGLYKSAVLAWLSGAPKRVGWALFFFIDSLTTVIYTHRVVPAGPHKVEQNIALAESAGARPNRARRSTARFPLKVSPEAES
jgi:ADP-heptose:LPS heptosyltransferase